MLPNRQIKVEAKAALSGNWGIAIGIWVVYLVLGAAIAFTFIGPSFSQACSPLDSWLPISRSSVPKAQVLKRSSPAFPILEPPASSESFRLSFSLYGVCFLSFLGL